MELIFKLYSGSLRFLTLILILICKPTAALTHNNLSKTGYVNGELEGVCNMVLYNILPGGKPMAIYFDIKNGAIKSAIAMSREFNRVPYNIDFSDLIIKDSTLSGAISVKINSDGYTPKDGKALMCRIRLNMVFRNGKATGKYTGLLEQDEVKGMITGELRPGKMVDPIRLVLDCENAIQDNVKSKLYSRRTTFSMSIRDGKVYGARFDPVGSIVDVSMQIHVRSTDLKIEGTKLTLTTVSQIIRQGGDTIIAIHMFDGFILGDAAAGTVRSRFGDKESPEPGSFLGKVSTGLPPIKSGNCLYSVVLYDVLPRGGYFKLFLSSTGGKITHGFATSPNSSNFTHSIDISELKLNGSKLSGVVKVTLKPDSWTSYKNPLCTFSIIADIIDEEIIGTYTGSINNGNIKGDIDGSLYPKPILATMGKMTIKLENGLTGGKDWENRAFLNFDFKQNKILKGNISNNHTDMKGTVYNGKVEFDENQISFDVNVTAAKGGNVDTGKYNFKGIGTVVGVYCAGSFQTYRDNKLVKNSNFWAIVPEYNKETNNGLPVAWIIYQKVESLGKDFAYTLGSGSTGVRAKGEPIGHYFPDMPDPLFEVDYPLWDYSEISIKTFRKHAGDLEYPRTWGFPEIYGEESYSWWMYSLHEQTAALAGIIREEISKSAPGLILFRNTTRMNIFDLSNDHDGSGQELLTRNLDIVHLDPYPVGGYGDTYNFRQTYFNVGLNEEYAKSFLKPGKAWWD